MWISGGVGISCSFGFDAMRWEKKTLDLKKPAGARWSPLEPVSTEFFFPPAGILLLEVTKIELDAARGGDFSRQLSALKSLIPACRFSTLSCMHIRLSSCEWSHIS